MRIEQEANRLINDFVHDRLDLTVQKFSEKLNIHICYNHKANFTMRTSDIDIIAIKFDNAYKMFEVFCHELGHLILHHTNQRLMPFMFNQMQEAEAYRFAMCVMMPEKLIYRHELWTAQDIMSYFHVDEKTALERIEMLIASSKLVPINY